MEKPGQCVKEINVNNKYARSAGFIANFGLISNIVLKIFLSTLNKQILAF